MDEAARKIQGAFRRKRDGKTSLLNFKDVMKKLMEAEKAKERLNEILDNMQVETVKYFHGFLNKNIDVRILLFWLINFVENN
jgi:hypothetical protein